MNVPALFGRLSVMCFVLRQTQRDNESPHPWDLAGHERVVGGVDKHPSLNLAVYIQRTSRVTCPSRDSILSRRLSEVTNDEFYSREEHSEYQIFQLISSEVL